MGRVFPKYTEDLPLEKDKPHCTSRKGHKRNKNLSCEPSSSIQESSQKKNKKHTHHIHTTTTYRPSCTDILMQNIDNHQQGHSHGFDAYIYAHAYIPLDHVMKAMRHPNCLEQLSVYRIYINIKVQKRSKENSCTHKHRTLKERGRSPHPTYSNNQYIV